MPTRRRSDILRPRLAARKLVSLGPRGWLLLFQAQWSILEATSIVRNRPQGVLVQEIVAASDSSGRGSPQDRTRVEAIGLAIDRMARVGLVRPLCLVRSIALQRLLNRNGIPGSRILIGVRMSGTSFEAHAWVEWMGTVIGEDPDHIRTFRPFSDLSPDPSPFSWATRDSSS